MSDKQEAIAEILELAPVVPVLIIDDVEKAIPLAKALVAGGIPVLEITLRTPCAIEAIRRISAEVPNAVVGAGTVINPTQYQAVAEAGARFVVSPGHSIALLDAAKNSPVPFLPGAVTPAEVIELVSAGYRYLKFFPAEPAGGIPMLKAFASPLPEVRFCPTGGIDLAKAPQYLALPNVVAVGGSWVAPADAIMSGDWGRIEKLAREASQISRTGRGGEQA
jgi:2-dehydro-3-deoxyphosphogluconate aldolase / (4S)-4-hydroxy-2-oxoglutarate aldolase